MKCPIIIFLFLVISIMECSPASAQSSSGVQKIRVQRQYRSSRVIVEGGDTLRVIDLSPVYIFAQPIDAQQHARLIRNVKVAYPIAKEANLLLADIERTAKRMKSQKEQRVYIKRMEAVVKARYIPVLKKMTFSQGKILIKLVDRETDRTSYAILQELRGNFTATLWQGVANIFGADLKSEYDKDKDDKLIEKIIILIEAGQL